MDESAGMEPRYGEASCISYFCLGLSSLEGFDWGDRRDVMGSLELEVVLYCTIGGVQNMCWLIGDEYSIVVRFHPGRY